ncbi:helix-turn-helix domain-containing protein [Sphingopyxis alaskensis]|uniref:helix-turn-helix domain-containing protein n=1 Tax=Sphingopyxis alaskensis TaxID=117207 RepID=UPI002041C427|nr:hypothetical protein [Sphingopyxis alaskensis]
MTSPLSIEERVARIEAVLGLDPTAAPRVPWPLRRTAVLRDAAALWDVEVDDLIGITKVRELVLPRAAVVMVLRDEPPMSYSQIGRLLCRDHSTIINLERIAHRQFCDDVAFRAKVAVLRSQIVPKTECV